MGRSRGGLTTKIHALVDADGRPIRLELTPGQAGDVPMAATLLDKLSPGATLIADRAYDTNAIRNLATERGAWANIPPRSIRKGSFAFSTWVYRQRNLVERFFRELSDMGGVMGAGEDALAELNDRYGLEMQPETVPDLVQRFGLRVGEPLSGGWTARAR